MNKWKRRAHGYRRMIATLCDQLNALAESEAAALNKGEQYRQEMLEMDKEAKGDLRVKEDEVRRMRESRDTWTRSYNELRISRDEAEARVAELEAALEAARKGET